MFKTSFILLAMAAFALSASHGLALSRQSSEDSLGSTRGLINNVITNLQEAATDAGQAVTNFTAGIQAQVQDFRQDLMNDVNKIKETFQQAVTNATMGVASAGLGVHNCITKTKKEAETALNETVHSVVTCADNQLDQIVSQVSSLIAVTKSAAEAAEEIKAKVLECGTNTLTGNIFGVGMCLGGVLWETNVKTVTITGQSALLITRINLSMATLPSALNICMASELAQAATTVGQLAQQLGQCSVGAIAGNNA